MMTLGMLASSRIPISYVGAAEASATTITIPTHRAGDLIFMIAIRDTSGTLNASPAPWTQVYTNNTPSTFQIRVATLIATAPGTASGTWTGASKLHCFVYRGCSLGANAWVYLSGNSATYPNITMQVTNGSSWIAGAFRSGLANLAIPAGRTSRLDGGTSSLDLWDTNGGVSSYTPDTVTNGTSVQGWYGSIELKE